MFKNLEASFDSGSIPEGAEIVLGIIIRKRVLVTVRRRWIVDTEIGGQAGHPNSTAWLSPTLGFPREKVLMSRTIHCI